MKIIQAMFIGFTSALAWEYGFESSVVAFVMTFSTLVFIKE